MTKSYPSSYLYTNVAELLHELDLDYKVGDVTDFGYKVDEGIEGAVYVELIERDETGAPVGRVRHTRWVKRDISYADWGKPPTDYPVIA